NIYTEQGTPFLFTRKIPGTSLIWGSQGVAQGQDHYLQGKNGARFAGFVYGTYTGGEEYRPGRTKKKGEDGSILGGGNDSADALHPCEYEEYSALSYGYPLAPGRSVIIQSDSLQIDSVMDCTMLHVSISALNPDPVGLRSIALEPTTVVNAKLIPISPSRLSDIVGKTQAQVAITPINPLKDAEATLVIKDRTGRAWNVYYTYQAERLDKGRDSINFGVVTKDQSQMAAIIYINPLKRDVKVVDVKLASGLDGFTIVGSNPPVPVTLKPGGNITVTVKINPNIDNKLYQDSLKLVLGCVNIAIPLRAETVQPIITIPDINFGIMVQGEPARSMLIDICNNGRGFISFIPDTAAGASPDVLAWLDTNFHVSASALDSLNHARLGPNECFSLRVTFTPGRIGLYRTTARAWATTRQIRDTSVWMAEVKGPSSVDAEATGSGYRLDGALPNPSSGKAEIAYRLGASGTVDVTIYNAAGEQVALLADGQQSAGEHRLTWDVSSLPGGLYYCRIASGCWSASRPMIVAR
ncbi:MAG: Por secretion system C-terminal sorting protein, partial [Chlorobi bacterium]|nr:Por secretion system C-terminal sorting protein [Chlorobiota bacterium]